MVQQIMKNKKKDRTQVREAWVDETKTNPTTLLGFKDFKTLESSAHGALGHQRQGVDEQISVVQNTSAHFTPKHKSEHDSFKAL